MAATAPLEPQLDSVASKDFGRTLAPFFIMLIVASYFRIVPGALIIAAAFHFFGRHDAIFFFHRCFRILVSSLPMSNSAMTAKMASTRKAQVMRQPPAG